MESTDPKEIKQLVKHLANYDEGKWRANAPDILRTALDAKFSQNTHLKDALLKTGETMLGEASASDPLFGIGMSLRYPKALDPTQWTGTNVCGRLLMDIRNNLN